MQDWYTSATDMETIELYDMQGIRVHIFLAQEMRQAGTHEEIIHIDESIPVGNYFW